tara:strand:+ start:4455 stop:6134 length:1680 start_codon:yes stop_codon:yes gene_type:complete
MSIKIKRIQSIESGDFNVAGRTRANFEIPASLGFTDLENSQVVFRMNMEVTGNDADSVDATNPNMNLLPPYFAGRHKNLGISPIDIGGCQAMIRNASVRSQEYGQMNEMRHQNVVNSNLDYYKKYSSEAGAWNNFNGGGNFSTHDPNVYNRIQPTPFLVMGKPTELDVLVSQDLTGDGHITQAVTAEVRCSLKHLDRMADGTRQFPNLAVGDLTYRLEFEDVREITATAPPVAYNMAPVTLATDGLLGGANNPLSYQFNDPMPDTNPNSNNTENVNKAALEYLPWYVGQPVAMNYKKGGAAQIAHLTSIKTLSVSSAGVVTIILVSQPGGATIGDAMTEINLQLHVGSSVKIAYNVQEVFCEMHCLQLTPQGLQQAQSAMSSLQIPFMEHRLVQKVLNVTGDYSETLSIEPGCAGVAVLTPLNNRLVSCIDKARDYRFSIEGRYTTNRDVHICPLINSAGLAGGRQLHNHLLQKFYGNLGQQLVRFDSPVHTYDFGSLSDDLEQDSHSIYPLVTPIVGNDAIINFQLRCEGANTMQTKEIFYVSIYPRSLNFKDGRLVM